MKKYALLNSSNHTARSRHSIPLACLFLILSTTFIPVQNSRADVGSVAVSEAILKSIGKAQTQIIEQHFDIAIEQLNSSLEQAINSQEKALVLNALGYCQFMQDKHDAAIGFYQKALEQSPISNGLKYDLLLAVGQLYFSTEQYAKSIQSLVKAIELNTKADTALHIQLGQAYFRAGSYQKALIQTKLGMDIADKQGIKPKEQWLALLRVIHLELNQMTELAEVLEKLVKRFPKKKYWLQLASVYATLDEKQKQLTTLEIAHRQNVLTLSKEYIYLAHLYLQADIPHKAAKLLNTEMKAGRVEKTDKNLYLESQSWLLAQEFEKSIPPLQEAAIMSTSGNYYFQLGQIYMSLDQWKNASTAFIQGLRKGQLRRPDIAFMALGTALFYQGAHESARDAFVEASRDERSSVAANRWIEYLNSILTSSSS